MFQILCRFAFLLSTFHLSNQTPKITWILMLYQANAPTLTRCNALKHTPKLTIHDIQTLKHNTLVNEILLMQFNCLIFVLNCITGTDENYVSHCRSTSVPRAARKDALNSWLKGTAKPVCCSRICYWVSSLTLTPTSSSRTRRCFMLFCQSTCRTIKCTSRAMSRNMKVLLNGFCVVS